MFRAIASISFLLLTMPYCLAQTFDADLANLIRERDAKIAEIDKAFLKDVEALRESALRKMQPKFEAAMKSLDFETSEQLKSEMESIQNKRFEVWTGRTIFAQHLGSADGGYSYFIRMPFGIWVQLLPKNLFRFSEQNHENATFEFAHENGSTVRIRGNLMQHRMAETESRFRDVGRGTWLTDVFVDGIPQPATR